MPAAVLAVVRSLVDDLISLLDLYHSSANVNGGSSSTGFLLHFTANNYNMPLLNSTPPEQRCGGEELVPVFDAIALYAVNSTVVTSVGSPNDVASID